MVHTDDTKLVIFNVLMFMLTFTNLDVILKTLLVVVTLGFTIDKWVSHRKELKEKKDAKEIKE